MKKMIVAAVLTVFVAGGIAVFAHCGNCPGDKPAAAVAPAKPATCCAALKLTDDQQAQVAKLKEQCGKATCTSECKATCDEGMKKILTADQYEQWKAMCAAKGKAGRCPVAGKDATK